MEVVQRALEYNESKLTRTGTYHIKTITHQIDPTPTWNKNGEGWENDEIFCDLDGGYNEIEILDDGTCYKKYCDCPKGETCDSGCHTCTEEYSYTCKLGGCSSNETDVGSCIAPYIRNCKSNTTTKVCSEETYYKRKYGKTFWTYKTTNN